MRSQQAASDYQSEKEEEVQKERVIYGTARDTPNNKETPQLTQLGNIFRIIRLLNGTDDMVIGNFIEKVRCARSQCSNKQTPISRINTC